MADVGLHTCTLRGTDLPARLSDPFLPCRAKNKRELNAKQTGATLGDESAGDTSSWAKNLKKQAKLKAERLKQEAKRREEEEEMDRLGAEDKYTESEYSRSQSTECLAVGQGPQTGGSRPVELEDREGAHELTFGAPVFFAEDLAGIKVSHDMDDFEEGEHILTLKDSRILDGDEDELMNVDLAGHDDDERNVELKRKRKEYSGYDDDEFDPSMLGMKKKVLSKYDVDIDGQATEELVSRRPSSACDHGHMSSTDHYLFRFPFQPAGIPTRRNVCAQEEAQSRSRGRGRVHRGQREPDSARRRSQLRE